MELQILKEFKSDMIEKFTIVESKYVSSEEQKDIEKILDSKTEKEKKAK